jgi:hypothetical protein
VTTSADVLRGQALDSLQALTIFVAFVTVLFGLRYPAIAAALAKPLSGSDRPIARENEKKELRRLFWSQCAPLTLLSGAPAYLFLPLSVRIVRESSFSLWDFDTLKTGFVFLTGYLAVFFGWSLYLSTRLALKSYRK